MKGRQLLRAILREHKKRLPPEMRTLGDRYVSILSTFRSRLPFRYIYTIILTVLLRGSPIDITACCKLACAVTRVRPLGAGTGWVVDLDPEPVFVTNAHVVSNAHSVSWPFWGRVR